MRYSLPPKLDADAPGASAPAPRRPVSAERAVTGMPEATQRRITELYERLNRVDHYGLLGVSATDDAKAIKRAYFALAKEHHPDRWFRKDIGALRGKIEAIFNAMTTAEATLTNAKRRAEYDAYLRDVLKTRIDRRRAEALEASKDWAAAAEVWARIVEQLPTDAYVQHRRAYTLLRSGSGYDAATAAATRAIELDSTRAEYRVTAANLHLAEGRDRSALAQLAVACEIEPDRADLGGLHAALGVRVARARSA
ncbi:MAG: DnaJ domain-containing protein [Labilithrix sp.]|nr:DnaJ domain-containing protein [Labilithrix sp.]MCW5831081.1 DnaJ domain-containing protein [Labilithrix sp.]